jgi:hypothetical protein
MVQYDRINDGPGLFEAVRRTAITNLLGYLPILNALGPVVGVTTSSDGNDTPSHGVQSGLPVVTYISRQGTAAERRGPRGACADAEKTGERRSLYGECSED